MDFPAQVLRAHPDGKLQQVAVVAERSNTPLFYARVSTGVLAAALAVDAPVFGIRNGPTTNTKRVVIVRLKLQFSTQAAFTAVQQFGFYLEKYNTANLAGGQTYEPLKARLEADESVCKPGGAEGGDIRASTTAALTVAGVTFLGEKVPVYGWNDLAVARDAPWVDAIEPEDPVALAPGEGLAIRNLVVWPAAGTGTLAGFVKYYEETPT